MDNTNEYGLTFQDWLLAAGVHMLSWSQMVALRDEHKGAWSRGEDPSDWRAEYETHRNQKRAK